MTFVTRIALCKEQGKDADAL